MAFNWKAGIEALFKQAAEAEAAENQQAGNPPPANNAPAESNAVGSAGAGTTTVAAAQTDTPAAATSQTPTAPAQSPAPPAQSPAGQGNTMTDEQLNAIINQRVQQQLAALTVQQPNISPAGQPPNTTPGNTGQLTVEDLDTPSVSYKRINELWKEGKVQDLLERVSL